MIEILIGIIVIFAAFQAWAMQMERKRSIDREREYMAAIFAKDVGQYIQAIDALKKTSKDKLSEMKLENELAVAAAKLEESGKSYPVS